MLALVVPFSAALATVGLFGYGGLDMLAQRSDCQHAAFSLARDTIRAAAARAHAGKRRLVAIDLRGPFTVDGACGSGSGGTGTFNVRSVERPCLRLAAYARVSYAR